jgi:hypothetical protein
MQILEEEAVFVALAKIFKSKHEWVSVEREGREGSSRVETGEFSSTREGDDLLT